jgi:hypothetical protein
LAESVLQADECFMTELSRIPSNPDQIQRVVLAYTRPGEETTITRLLETTRPAIVLGHPAISADELKRVMMALEAEGQFVRREWKSITFWRRTA